MSAPEPATTPGDFSPPGPGSVNLSLLHSLLARWAEARDRGERLAPEDLASDPAVRKELARRIAQDEELSGAGPAVGPVAVPGYEVLAELGQGGMGVVYHARQRSLNRPVALKVVLGAGPADRKAVIRFLAEAEAVAAIDHPHVVRIFDYGEHAGRPFMALEYLPGGTLADRLRDRGRLDPPNAAALVAGIARGVQAAHDRGIVHRDLKPANVLFDAAGAPKVADFGLAKRGTGDLTETGTVMGTPAYMSPEQAKGETKFVTPAADVWALGVILYECLTGTRPFAAADSWAVLKQVIDADPAPVRTKVPAVPRDLDRVCRKCLAKDPADRYPTAAALADDLDRFGRGEPVAVRRPSIVERGYRWARRKPAAATAYALSILVLVVVSAAAGAVWLWRDAEKARDRADDENALRRVAIANQAWYENNVTTTLRELDQVPPARRGWEWRYMAGLCSSEVRVHRLDESTHGISVSPDRTKIAGAVQDGTVFVWDARTGREIARHRVKGGGGWTAAEWLDDDRVLIARDPGTVAFWTVAGGTTPPEWDLHPDRPARDEKFGPRIAISPDRAVAAVSLRASVFLMRTTSGEVVGTLSGGGCSWSALCFGPDGDRLYGAGSDFGLRTWDPRTRGELARPWTCGTYVYALANGPDGRLWVGDETGRLHRLCPDRRDPPVEHQIHTSRIWSIDFTPDQQHCLTTSMDQTARTWWVDDMSPERTFRGHLNDVENGFFLEGGSRVVTCGDHTVRVWDATRDQESRTFACGVPVGTVAFSPDGRLLAAAFADEVPPEGEATPKAGIAVWDVGTGRPLESWEGTKDVAGRALAFAPDGRSIAYGGRKGVVHVASLAGGPERAWAAHEGPVLAVAFDPTGGRLASAGKDGRVRLWDVATGREVWSADDADALYGLAFSPDGRRVATGGAGKVVVVRDAATGGVVHRLEGHTYAVSRVCFSRDGRGLVSASWDNTVRLWDLAAGREERRIKSRVFYIHGVALSPDGSRLADAAGDKTARLFDLRTGMETLALRGHGDEVTDVAFSPDGHRLATASLDGTVRLWEAPPGATVTVPPDVNESFNPD